MLTRTTETMVTFSRNFRLSGVGERPPGTYLVVAEEEQLQGLSFNAYRKVETRIYVPAVATNSSLQQAFLVDADELEAALIADRGE
jgi:hypothetical protein